MNAVEARTTGRTPKCVVALFGIDRRLDLTSQSLHACVVHPAAQVFDRVLVAHLWDLKRIQNERSRESGELAPPRINLLPQGQYRVEPPIDVANEPGFLALRGYGDFWQDDFRSLANLYSQLVSLQRVTEMALAADPECVVFARPDLLYHDSLLPVLTEARKLGQDMIFLPHWQPHGGYNDRFAVCYGRAAIRTYGARLEEALPFCRQSGGPLHAEKLLRFAIEGARMPVRRMRVRASRVRLTGEVRREDFSFFGWKPALRVVAGRLRRARVFQAAAGP